MSLMSTAARFARSPQGRRLFGQAKQYAQSPQGKAKVERVRRQLSQGRKPKPR